MIPTYDFYQNVYFGWEIPQRAFSSAVSRAAAILERFRSVYRIAPAGETEVKMALCAMAETVYRYQRRGGVRSSRAGNVSVTYAGEEKSLTAALRESAGIFLDIYRGVES